MSEPTAAQRLMVEDGLPPMLIIPSDERRAAWKGRRLRATREMNFGKQSRTEDPATTKVRREIEAAERAKQERKAEHKRDAKLLQRRRAQLLKEDIKMAHSDVGPKEQGLRNLRNQKPVRIVKTTTIQPPAPIVEAQQETTMKKSNTAKAAAKARVSKALGRPLTEAKSGTKRAAKAKTPKPAKTARDPAGAKTVRPGSKLEIVVGLLTRKEGCTAAEVLKATDWPAVSMPQQARAAGLTLRQEKDGKVTRYWGT